MFRITLKWHRIAPKDTGNTKLFLVVGAGLLGGALAPIAAPAALGLIGFSSTGVVAGLCPTLFGHQPSADTPPFHSGTMAAAIQSSIGNVAAGSLFATAQSVAMGGAFPAMGSVIASGITSVGAYLAIPGGKKS
jgi:hypothetical protein